MKRAIQEKIQPAAQRQAQTGLILAAPVILGSGIFFLIPFCLMLRYSLTFGIGGSRFVGLRNYREVLESPAFRLAAANTIRFLAIGLPLIMALGLLLALLLRQKLPGAGLLRRVLLLPMVLPVASIVMLVQILFAGPGILNGILEQWGLFPRQWLNGPESFWVLVGLYVWKNCGYNVVLFLAGLNMIPEELYQTAELDGAGPWAKFRFITLPLLIPSLFFGFIFSIVNSFKVYREAFLLGGEYPAQSIYLLQHFLNNNFRNLNYQRLSVAAIILFSVIFLLVGLLLWAQRKTEA